MHWSIGHYVGLNLPVKLPLGLNGGKLYSYCRKSVRDDVERRHFSTSININNIPGPVTQQEDCKNQFDNQIADNDFQVSGEGQGLTS
jgi:hypothetical protein